MPTGSQIENGKLSAWIGITVSLSQVSPERVTTRTGFRIRVISRSGAPCLQEIPEGN